MDSLFQNIVPAHLIEVLIIILVSALLGWLLAMYLWKKRLSTASSEWEMRFNAKARDYNELRNLYTNLDKQNKEHEDQVISLEAQIEKETTHNKKLTEEQATLHERIKVADRKNQELGLKISDLELIRRKHTETLPQLEAARQEIEGLNKHIHHVSGQKEELNLVINSLKDYRSKFEDKDLQLQKSQQQVEELETLTEELREAVKYEGERGPRVLELSGKLRWADSEMNLLSAKLDRLEQIVDLAAFGQLEADAEIVELKRKLANTPDPEQLTTPYQVQIWEKEGALRWSESEKALLTQKIEELEYAKQTVLSQANGTHTPAEELNGGNSAEPMENGLDREATLTRISLQLENALEEKAQLETESRKYQNHILELKGRSKWILSEKQVMQASINKLKAHIQDLEQQRDSELKRNEELEGSIKQKQEALVQMEQKFASEQLAQELIVSEEVDDLQTQVQALQQTAYLSAQEQADQLAAQSRLSLEKHNLMAHLETLELSLMGMEAEKQELLAELDSLKNTAYRAAQQQADQEGEAIQNQLKQQSLETSLWEMDAKLEEKEKQFQRLLEDIQVLQELEAQKEKDLMLTWQELETFQESAYSAAQSQADDEAANVRLQVQINSLKHEIESLLSQQESIQHSLNSELQEVRESMYRAAQLQVNEEAAGVRKSLHIQELSGELTHLQERVTSEKNELLKEISDLRNAIEKADNQRGSQETQVQELREKLNLAQKERDSLKEMNEAEKLAFEELKQFQLQMGSEHREKEGHLEELQGSVQQAAQAYWDQYGELTRLSLDVKGKAATIDQLETELAQKRHQLEELALAQNNLEAITGSVQHAAQDYWDQFGELTRLNLSLKDKDGAIQQLETELESKAHQIADLSAAQKSLEAEKDALTLQLETLHQGKHSSEEYLQEVNSQLAISQSTIQELHTKVTDLEQAIIKVEEEKERHLAQIKVLEDRILGMSQLKSSPPSEGTLSGSGPVSVMPAVELTEEAKDQIRERIFAKRDWLELNFGRIGIASPSDQDDLQIIEGIDSFTEERLNMVRIFTYKQIANFSSEEERILTEALELIPGIISQQKWVEQAQVLR